MELNLSAIKRMNISSDHPVSIILRRLPLFEWLDASMLDSLASRCIAQVFEAGSTVLSEGDASDGQAYIILSGNAHVFMDSERISSLSEGDLFWEYALICGENRSATVSAASHLECLVLKESDIMELSDGTNRLNDILTERIGQNVEASRGVFAG